MARDLLAEGRAEDVVHMIDPLLEPLEAAPAADTDQVLLHALMARVQIVHYGDVEQALDLLAPFESASMRAALDDTARAEAALWLGWGHARRDRTLNEEARALNLLDEARHLFKTELDVSGRCWAHIGRAQAYFAIDEYHLMREALDEAMTLQRKIQDKQAQRWIHDLRIAGLRFQGRYGDAQRHINALAALGQELQHRQVQGRAQAYQAALYLDLGRSTDRIIDTAKQAETMLRRSAPGIGYPLLAAYHAHISALLAQGDWNEADALIDTAIDEVGSHPTARAHLQTLRARLEMRRGRYESAEHIMESLFERAHHLPHGLQRSHVALLRGELLAHREDYEEAERWMERAYRNARETGHRGNQLHALLSLARLALDQNDLDTTEERIGQIDPYSDYFSVLPFAAPRFKVLGRHARQANSLDEARSSFHQALSAYSLIGDVYRTAQVQLTLAHPDLAPDPAQARTLLNAAIQTFKRLETTEELKTAQAFLEQRPAVDTDDEVPLEHTFGASLARASSSAQLVAKTWIQIVEELLPNRWIGVYRWTSNGARTCLHEHGTPPEPLPAPAEFDEPCYRDSVLWLPLHTPSDAAFCMGIALSSPEDPVWKAAHAHLKPWLPVVQLAFDRALLRPQQPEGDADESSDDEQASSPLDDLVYTSPAMQRLVENIHRICSSHNPVLITGENGTGKTTVARAIHATSERSAGPWKTLNCASVPPEPLETRLFGRANARDDTDPGIFQAAEGGTVFLREAGALPTDAQAKLLRTLEEGEIFPVGGQEPIPVDVRIIASTTQNLDERVRTGDFREALYYRLNVITLHVPPLRERREDIPLLVRHFLRTLRPPGTPVASVTNRAMEALLHYDWPGNVQQLRNELDRCLTLVNSEPAPTIDTRILSEAITEAASPQWATPTNGYDDILRSDYELNDILARTEKEVIERVLAECAGQITASARVLGLTRQGLYKKMKRLDIDASEFQSSTSDPALSTG